MLLAGDLAGDEFLEEIAKGVETNTHRGVSVKLQKFCKMFWAMLILFTFR